MGRRGWLLGVGDRVRAGQGGFGAAWNWKVFLKHKSPCPCYAMSPKKFPRGQVHSQSLISLFLKSFAAGLTGVGKQFLGQPHPCGKKIPVVLGQEACLIISMPRLRLGKRSLKSNRAGAVCKVTHLHTMNQTGINCS